MTADWILQSDAVERIHVERTQPDGAGAAGGEVNAQLLRDLVVCVRRIACEQGNLGCISASAAIADFFRLIRVDAQCIPVGMIAINRVARLLAMLRIRPVTKTGRTRFGARCVSVGAGANDVGQDFWGGHLVTVVEGRWLVDATLDQFACPGIMLPALVSDRGTRLLDQGRCSLTIDGSFAVYFREDDNVSYRDSEAWGPSSRTTMLLMLLGVIDAEMPKESALPLRLREHAARVAAEKAGNG